MVSLSDENIQLTGTGRASESRIGKQNRTKAAGKKSDTIGFSRAFDEKNGSKMVKSVSSGVNDQSFIPAYILRFPDKEQLREFLLSQIEETGQGK